MFEKIFSTEHIESSANYALFGGVFFTLVSFVTSYLLFKNIEGFVGISTILFTVILSLPIVLKLLESTDIEGGSSFLSKTKHLFDFYVYFFIGSFLILFLLSLITPWNILSPEQLFGESEKVISPQIAGLPPPPIPTFDLIYGIFKNNLYVMLISFMLSLLYGAGSLFLLILNASIFASTLSSVIRETALSTDYLHLFVLFSCNMGVFFFHMIPEVIAYFLAAIGGGILSINVAREKIFSLRFLKASKYSFLFLLAAIIVLIISAIIEVKISRDLLFSGTCLRSTTGVLIGTAIVIVAVIALEFIRRKKAIAL